MSNGLTWRILCDRIARGEATGVLCPAGEVPEWLARLESSDRVESFLREIGGGETILYFPTGAVVLFCSTPEEARALEKKSARRLVWVDEENALEAPLPAPKPEKD